MPPYDPSTWGDLVADHYDNLFGTRANTDDAVDFLASVAGRRRALELGIGTGRIAIPLSERGIKVLGIDASARMVEKLRQKPGSDAISVTIGNFADVKISGQFSMVYAVFNTFFALLSQEDQIRCFARVARHLHDEGVFVIEAFVPDLTRFDRGQRTSTIALDNDHAVLESTMHDPVTQRIQSAHMIVSESVSHFFPLQLRYAWPSELDLMARLVGMRLRDRWGGWKREPLTAASQIHVSVYEKVPTVVELPTKSRRLLRSVGRTGGPGTRKRA